MFLSNTRQVLVGFCSEGLYLIRASAQLYFCCALLLYYSPKQVALQPGVKSFLNAYSLKSILGSSEMKGTP